MKKPILLALIIAAILLICFKIRCLANEPSKNHSTILKGTITNKRFAPLKLKVFQIDKESLFFIERNLEDNSFIPEENLKITASVTSDNIYNLNDNEIMITSSTKLAGYITDIEPPKSFNREGYFNVTFNKVICPDGHITNLNKTLESKSVFKTYKTTHHVGKTVASLIGGSIAGILTSLQLGGIGTIVASNGYSLAAGATAGGFIGVVSGIVSKGKEATIEPGSTLTLAPVDEISLEKLKQIQCINHTKPVSDITKNKTVELEILSIKEKKELLGDALLMINIKFTNNTDTFYKLNNFFLKDSQGKEYSPSIINREKELLVSFPPNKTTQARLDFFVNYPKATHWLVLKNNKFTNEIEKWEVIKSSSALAKSSQ